MGNEVSGERHQIGTKRLRQFDGPLHAGLIHVGAEMNVTDLRDAETMEGFGQAGEVNFDVLSNRMPGFDKESVECGRARERNKPQPNEVAA
jgi:hypothetical protein